MPTTFYMNWLFHDAVANADVRVMNGSGTSKDLEGSGPNLRRECCRNFLRGTEDMLDYT